MQPARAPLRALLSLAPLRWIGWISYGLYLWHWPVYVFLTTDRVGLDGTGLLLVRLGATFAIAAGSYYLVEMPIRRGALSRRRALPRVVLPAAVALAAAALMVSTSDIAGIGARREAAARTADVVDASKDARARHGAQQLALAEQHRAVTAIFVGDSVSESLALGYGPQMGMPNLTVQSLALPGCGIARGRVIPGEDSDFGQQNCEEWLTRWQFGVDFFRPDVAVILTGTWEVFDRHVDDRDLFFGTPEYAAYLRGELERGLTVLGAQGASIVVLSMPCADEARPQNFFQWSKVIPEINRILRSFADAHPDKVTWIDLNGFVCPLSKWDRALGGAPFFPDGRHFSQASSDIVWKWLGPRLLRVAAQHRSRAFLGLDQVAFWG